MVMFCKVTTGRHGVRGTPPFTYEKEELSFGTRSPAYWAQIVSSPATNIRECRYNIPSEVYKLIP